MLAEVFGPIQRFDMESENGSQLLRFRVIPEPAARATLRNWVYPLSESRDADNDRASLSFAADSRALKRGFPGST
jgi:hypothetical protein